MKDKCFLAVVGLGYVGLPMALAFAKKGIQIIGFDVNHEKISMLRDGIDITRENTPEDLKEASQNLIFTDDPKKLKEASFIIVAVRKEESTIQWGFTLPNKRSNK